MACNQGIDIEEKEAKKEEVTMEEKLFLAVIDNDLESVQNSVESVKNIDMTNEEGDTAVMLATQENNLAIVAELIEAGANINIQNERQDNVLLYAGAEGHLEIVKLAIEAGADTTITNRYGGTALIPAADRGHVEVVDYLLKASDTDVNYLNNLHWTALLEAIILGDGGEGHQQIVDLLLRYGADVQISDKEGITPLQHAKNRGFTEMEELLLKAGARE